MPARLREMTAGCCHSNHTCPGYVVSVSKECSRTFQGFPGPILASAAAHHGFQTPNAANLSFFFFCSIFLFSSPVTLLSSCEAFRWDSAKLLSPLGSPVGKLPHYEGSAQDRIIQDSGPFKPSHRLYRTKRHRELVRTQPHLVHNMAVPEIEESPHSKARLKLSSAVSPDTVRTRVEENLKLEDEMEVKSGSSESHQHGDQFSAGIALKLGP